MIFKINYIIYLVNKDITNQLSELFFNNVRKLTTSNKIIKGYVNNNSPNKKFTQ